MGTRTVILGVLWLAGTVAAGEPPRTPARDARPQAAAKLEADAKALGLGVGELKRLRELGFTDAEILSQTKGSQRTARQVITEREVINDVAKIVADLEARLSQLPESSQAAEREASLRVALAKVRRDHRTSREELRRVLAGTSLLTADELKRVLGTSLFGADDLKRVLFSAGQEKR